MKIWTVVVWDDRDVESLEPASQLGTFYSRKDAEKNLQDYLKTEHGSHIIRSEIEETTKDYD